MEEIIKITEKDGQRAVNARELHAFLESKQEFANWIKGRIDKYGFVENQDYEVFDKFIKNPQGGRPTIEYALSLDMAKELSMVENNEKGRMARKYFIECEKAATKQTTLLEDKLKVIEFSARFLNLNDASKLMMLKSVTDPLGLPTPDYVDDKGIFHSASELLKEHGVEISAQAFNKLLEKEGLLQTLYRKSSNGKMKPYKNITKKGLDFGENKRNPSNQSETQPAWYDDKFDEVLKIVGLL